MTSSRRQRPDLVILDACCLINLFATGRAQEILEALPHLWAVGKYVAEEEVLEIAREGKTPASQADRGTIPIHPLLTELIENGTVEKLAVRSEEEENQLVRFAAQLDDGEAYTCALAIVRRARVATDDRKAIRVLRTAWKILDEKKEPVLRTSDMLFSWAGVKGVGEPELAQVVHAIARRATFFPPRDDPHFGRWMGLLGRKV